MFCAECGSFIAIGSKVFSGGSAATKSVAAAMAGPASAIAGAGTSGTRSGTMPLGSYSVAMAEYQRTGRRRLLLVAVSVVLVVVVGLSAIYAAVTRSDGGGTPEPAAALVVAPTTEPIEEAPVDEPEAQPIEEVAAEPEPVEPEPEPVEPEAVDDGVTSDEVEPVPAVEGSTLAQPVPEPEIGTEAIVADAVVPATEAGLADEVEPAVEPLPDHVEAAIEPMEPAKPARDPVRENPPVWRNGWVCDGELALKDERLRDWAITRVSFLPGDGFERVALQLERAGDGSGGAATVTAEAFPTGRVKQEVPAVRQPSSGRTTIALQFRGGVRSEVGLRGYQPSGLTSIKEFNSYPVGQTASRLLVSSSTSGCFRVRVPAFNASPNAQRGQVLIDIKS